MQKIEKVYLYVENNISLETIKKNIIEGKPIGIDAKEIEDKLGIVRNNASTLLNMLNKNGKLVKLQGRPVRFIPTKIMKLLIGKESIDNEYKAEEIQEIIAENEINNSIDKDPFTEMFGSNSSLKNQIEQAKAAVMYPPNGLHTLIIGPSGVGKTTFANKIYEYALKHKKKSTEEFPFVSFNCSDYYNNPQLLLSQLFGHTKGAYTGADSEKIGLVEKANGGILFLDEVHRLPPDGQEMLFYLMDNGEYHRLGETEHTRKSNVLIIAATTEDPQKVLLKTFLRRIPVIIILPALSEINVKERVNIVENLLTEEAIRVNRKIIVSPEVFKALLVYNCIGNIGQLKSDIKFICAKAFFRYVNQKDSLKIEFDMLPKFIKESIFSYNKLDSATQEFLNRYSENLVIYPTKEILYQNSRITSENIYEKIVQRLNILKEKGLTQDEINIEISKEIENYFSRMIRKFNYQDYNIRELYKVLDKDIVDFTLELVKLSSEKLNRKYDNRLMFSLAFHINSLIERVRLKKPIINHELSKIREIYNEEYKVASMIVKRIEERFNLNIPVDENGFIAILLSKSTVEDLNEDKIGILIITHGNSTATSMANVCNRLLNSNFVKAIDMPLEEDVSSTYKKARDMVKAIDKGKGVIILVDMGSLKEFGKKITEETGIITRTIEKVSTPIVLDVLRRVMYKNENIDEIYHSVISNDDEIIISKKPKAIITVCTTGKATSLMLKNIITNILQEMGNLPIEVIPIDYLSIQNNTKEYLDICQNYKLIACVGNVNPKINIPFFSLEEFINKKIRENFYRLIENEIYNEGTENKKSSYDAAREILEEFSLYINPKKTIDYIKKFIKRLDFEELNNNESLITSLAVHIGFMIERIITNNRATFDEVKVFKLNYEEKFLKIKEAIKIIEEFYNIEVTDDEICFIIQVIEGNSKK
jgi:transcriptional regulatory protein LevR/transcriptional regulator with AAA-type ATPase domain